MSEVINSTYEIIEKIGSGGGGNVFLANHLRLNKKVILKADKRQLKKDDELLRKEVDILKTLSHQYIPQVYDFFYKDGTTYTAMEYVEGESLDKPLRRGERFSQKQVIAWAIQLLQALRYLHEPVHGDPPKGFVHSDIKPANIMRRPNNDICLIDFNVALALGEEDAIGRSAGYASPEHYGLDFSGYGTVSVGNSTLTLDDTQSTAPVKGSSGKLSSTARRAIRPDVRSDIYSLGATLYHLLSGRRPAEDAPNVVPLSKEEFSPLLVDVITKAMEPNPYLRFQSADEMLEVLYTLHQRDPRTLRLKKTQRICYALTAVLAAAGILTSFTGLRRMQKAEANLKLAEYSANSFTEGDIDKAVSQALEAIPEKHGLFDPAVSAEAQEALTNALEVYDLKDGFRAYKTITLPAEPFDMSMAPDGRTFSCIYAWNLAVYDAETYDVIYEAPVTESALAEVKYINDGVIAYAGKDGIEVYDLDSGKVLWKGGPATKIAVSDDSNTIAAVYRDESHADVYDAKTGELRTTVDFDGKKQKITNNDIFANPHDNLLELNHDGSLMAVSFDDGSLEVENLVQPDDSIILFEENSGFSHFEGGFYEKYFAFSASNKNQSVFAVIDTDEKVQTGGFDGDSQFGVKTDRNGICLSYKNMLVRIHPVTGDQTPLVTTGQEVKRFAVCDRFALAANENRYMYFTPEAKLISETDTEISTDFVLINDGISVIGSMSSPILKIEKYMDHSADTLAEYSTQYSHDEARITHDKENLMLFSYKEFYILDKDGFQMVHQELPDPDDIYDQQFIRTDTSSVLEVTYTDGRVQTYDAKTGELLKEEQRDKPDLSLNEVFTTDQYRFEADLHGVTKVYSLKSGKQIRELPEDAYVTYVTQAGGNIVVQYITADGYEYGKLYNSSCDEIAVMPYLSDIYENQFIFDYPDGTLRTAGIYSLDELIEMGKQKLEGEN